MYNVTFEIKNDEKGYSFYYTDLQQLLIDLQFDLKKLFKSAEIIEIRRLYDTQWKTDN